MNDTQLLTIQEQEYLQAKIENEGFDYCFRFYSSFSDIKDEEFHKIRELYREVAGKLASYIDDPVSYRSLQQEVGEALTTNTQLPAEVEAQIKKEAQGTLTRASQDLKYSAGYFDGYYMGATEYASKLHKTETILALYKQADKTNSDLIERAITLLEKVKSRHEAGLLPDRLLYNEIKTFLDGK